MTEIQTQINPATDTEIVYVEGWKGKDEISIYEGPTYYKIIEHRKSKETGEVDESFNTIEKKDVDFLWNKIIINCALGEKYAYRYLVRNIIKLGRMDLSEVIPSFEKFNEIIMNGQEEIKEAYIDFLSEIMLETFNGGKFRKAIYFPVLYYPLKVLEAKGYIQYFGRGGIAKLLEGEFK